MVDFVRIMPGIPKANVKSRVILTPEHAKRLLMALQDNIKKYESVHGPIKNVKPGSDPMMPPMNFGGPTGKCAYFPQKLIKTNINYVLLEFRGILENFV